MDSPKQVEPVQFSSSSITVRSSDEFKAKVATAATGTVIQLDSSVKFRALAVPDGKSGLKIKPSAESVVIESDGASKPAMALGLGTSDISFQNLTFQSTNTSNTTIFPILARCGYNAAGTAEAKTLEELPNRIEFLQCKFLGLPDGNTRIGLLFNVRNGRVDGCEFREIHERQIESQCLLIVNGSGPFEITNNIMEGAGENCMLGGSDPTIPNLTIGDLTFTDNRLNKPLAWKGAIWGLKNLFETKHCQRAYIARNVMTNNWLAQQAGLAVLMTSRNGGRNADILFEDNVIQNVGGGLHVTSGDNNQPDGPTTGEIVLRNNLWLGVGALEGPGRVYQISTPDMRQIESLSILGDRWTLSAAPLYGRAITYFEGPSGARAVKQFTMKNCMGSHSQYGLIGDGVGTGKATLDRWTANYIVTGNVFLNGGNAASYPESNYFVVP
jgi:hypothetical protein